MTWQLWRLTLGVWLCCTLSACSLVGPTTKTVCQHNLQSQTPPWMPLQR
jgi:hypothetical protein